MIYHTWNAGDPDDAPALCGALETDQVPDGTPAEFCAACAAAQGVEQDGTPMSVVDLTDPSNPLGGMPDEIKKIALDILGKIKAGK